MAGSPAAPSPPIPVPTLSSGRDQISSHQNRSIPKARRRHCRRGCGREEARQGLSTLADSLSLLLLSLLLPSAPSRFYLPQINGGRVDHAGIPSADFVVGHTQSLSIRDWSRAPPACQARGGCGLGCLALCQVICLRLGGPQNAAAPPPPG